MTQEQETPATEPEIPATEPEAPEGDPSEPDKESGDEPTEGEPQPSQPEASGKKSSKAKKSSKKSTRVRVVLSDEEVKALKKQHGAKVLKMLEDGKSQSAIAEELGIEDLTFVWAIALVNGYVNTKTERGAKLKASWTKRLAA